MLSKKSISEFKEIYFKDIGVQLTDKEALKLATEFLCLIKTIYKPIPITIKHN